MPHEDDLIRVAGAARLAGVSQGTVRRWLAEGRLRRYRDGRGRVWVSRTQVLELITPKPETAGCGA
jgi:excisionase family DNA binding protein